MASLNPGVNDVLQLMRRAGVAMTRENYIDLAWGGDVPEEWTVELEGELPVPLQRWDFFRRGGNGTLVYVGPGELQDFNPYHDPHSGEFTTGGGGTDDPVAFVSPNTGQLDFQQARAAMGNERHRALAHASNDIDRQLGIAGTNRPVLGAWADGAEHSLMFSMPKASPEQARVASAMKGFLANQKAVLLFQPGDGGHFMGRFDMKGSLDDIHRSLLKSGLAFHTLEPTKSGAHVLVFGMDDATMEAVGKTAIANGTTAKITRGNGEFIGTAKEDGTDAEQRADARRVYEHVIADASAHASSGLRGRDVGAIWRNVRDRWGRRLRDQIARLDSDLADFNPNHDPQTGEFSAGGGGSNSGSVLSKLRDAERRSRAIPTTEYNFTPERVALRDKIVNDLYDQNIATRVRGKEATIILGLPAAGKSTLAQPLVKKGALEVDPDLAKLRLPEYENGVGASAVHEESSLITKRVLAKALANGDNFVWPRVNSPDKVNADIRNLHKLGYKVHVQLLDVPVKEAMRSAVDRFVKTGRYVPLHLVKQFGDQPMQAFKLAKGLADTTRLFRRAPDGGVREVSE